MSCIWTHDFMCVSECQEASSVVLAKTKDAATLQLTLTLLLDTRPVLTCSFMCVLRCDPMVVCLWVSCGQLTSSQMHGVSKSFLLWGLYCWNLGSSQTPCCSLPLSFSVSLLLSVFPTASFKQGHQYSSLFSPLLAFFFLRPTFSAYLHHLWASQITAQIGCSTFSPPFKQNLKNRTTWGMTRGPIWLSGAYKAGNNWRSILSETHLHSEEVWDVWIWRRFAAEALSK